MARSAARVTPGRAHLASFKAVRPSVARVARTPANDAAITAAGAAGEKCSSMADDVGDGARWQ
jgi:hypothetical protein